MTLFPKKLMLQNASYMFFKKRNKTTTEKRKKSHPAGVEPEAFYVEGQHIIHCATQPLLRLHIILILTFLCPQDKLFKMAQKMQTYNEISITKGHP